jgi:hypothetical protein
MRSSKLEKLQIVLAVIIILLIAAFLESVGLLNVVISISDSGRYGGTINKSQIGLENISDYITAMLFMILLVTDKRHTKYQTQIVKDLDNILKENGIDINIHQVVTNTVRLNPDVIKDLFGNIKALGLKRLKKIVKSLTKSTDKILGNNILVFHGDKLIINTSNLLKAKQVNLDLLHGGKKSRKYKVNKYKTKKHKGSKNMTSKHKK